MFKRYICSLYRIHLVVVDIYKSIKVILKQIKKYSYTFVNIYLIYVIIFFRIQNIFFNVLQATYVNFFQSSKNKKICEMQSNLGLIKRNIQTIWVTRWVCRYKNCVTMLNNYSSILNIFKEEIEEQKDNHVVSVLNINI